MSPPSLSPRQTLWTRLNFQQNLSLDSMLTSTGSNGLTSTTAERIHAIHKKLGSLAEYAYRPVQTLKINNQLTRADNKLHMCVVETFFTWCVPPSNHALSLSTYARKPLSVPNAFHYKAFNPMHGTLLMTIGRGVTCVFMTRVLHSRMVLLHVDRRVLGRLARDGRISYSRTEWTSAWAAGTPASLYEYKSAEVWENSRVRRRSQVGLSLSTRMRILDATYCTKVPGKAKAIRSSALVGCADGRVAKNEIVN